MNREFWTRPVPHSLRRGIFALILVCVLAVGVALSYWIYFHQSYEHWLNDPPERLVGHSHVLIRDGEVLPISSGNPDEVSIDDHLVSWRLDHEHIAELSRSDVLQFPLLGRAYVKVYLHTRHPNRGVGGRRVESVSVFVREDGRWRWVADYNLALE